MRLRDVLESKSQIPHIVAVPSPKQGHVIPMLELVQSIAKCGFRITFVNTEFNHKKVKNALAHEDGIESIINFVSMPDGLESWEDRNDLKKSWEAMVRVMPGKLEDLLEKFNQSDDDKVTCLIADETMGWSHQVAKKMQIKLAVFWPASTATLASMFSIQKMIDDGIIDERGSSIGDQMIQLSPTMPKIRTKDLAWACLGDLNLQELIFQIIVENNKSVGMADWLICNSFYELDPASFSLFPNITPIGPLLASNRLGKSRGSFWEEDSTCLKWLDHQSPNSVIYVAFGSSTFFDNSQFKELAKSLEVIGKPFLWVVRPDLTNDLDESYLKAFKERVATYGKIVDWAPQESVLSHSSVACFVSHCGWNSTLEGLSNGVPFLCWPYYGDQILNKIYICDVWKMGLSLDRDERGIYRQEEIMDKVEKLLTDKRFKAKALKMKEMATDSVKEGGLSHKNFDNFVEWMRT